MSTPGVRGPFEDGYKHKHREGQWRVSMNPAEHGEEMVTCQRVSDGHFILIRRDNLVPEPPDLFIRKGEMTVEQFKRSYTAKVKAMTPEELVKSLEECGVVFDDARKEPYIMLDLAGWLPIETAPTDNKRLLYLATIREGKLVALDYDGIWESDYESHEMPQVYHYWASANGIEEPTHWAYQDIGVPPPSPDTVKYGVRFSAHGMAFQPTYPQLMYSYEEADAIKKEWEARADTVGGIAEIVTGFECQYSEESLLDALH